MAKNDFGWTTPFGTPKKGKIPTIFDGLDSGAKSSSRSRTACPKTLKIAMRQRWWGDTLNGECFCCGRPLHFDDAEAGHIRAAAKGGEWSPDNNRLICRTCNGGMRTVNMKTFMRHNHPARYSKFWPKEDDEVAAPKARTVNNSPKSRAKKPRAPRHGDDDLFQLGQAIMGGGRRPKNPWG